MPGQPTQTGVDAMQPRFEYHRPSSLSEACSLLQSLGTGALPLAGGTDVLVDLRRGSKHPRHVVSLADLHELREIAENEGELRIGALVTPAQLEDSENVVSHRPELLDAVGVFGTPQVRHRATVGGSLCTAASCGDLAPLLVALNARVTLATADGIRDVSLEDFFGDHRETAIQPGEILKEVVLPIKAPGEGASYQTFGLRKANFITVAGVAAYLRFEGETCADARITLGAVAPIPLLVPGAAEALKGETWDDERIEKAATAAQEAAIPISDIRGSAEHRRELVKELCRRALDSAEGRAR